MWHHMRTSFPLQVLESQSSPPYQTSLSLQREKLRPRGMELPSWHESNPGGLTPQNSHGFLSPSYFKGQQRDLPTPRPSTAPARPNVLQSSHPVTFYKVFDQKEKKVFFSSGLEVSYPLVICQACPPCVKGGPSSLRAPSR